VAIYHFKSQIIKRATGKSATASAAYRAREKIKDERTGLIFDYRHVSPISYCEILAPENAPSWVKDRAILWNEVEKAEKRKDSQLAREIMVALPKELSKKGQIILGKEFIQDNYVSKGMIADLSFHDLDKKNPHMHVMLTTRKIEQDGFGLKERNWNPRFGKNKAKGDRLKIERQLWQDYVNQALEKMGLKTRVDCRSLKERDINLIPQVHLGPAANGLEKRGIKSRLGDEHRRIEKINQGLRVWDVQRKLTENEIKGKKAVLEYLEYKKDKELNQKNNFNRKNRILNIDKNKLASYQEFIKKFESIIIEDNKKRREKQEKDINNPNKTLNKEENKDSLFNKYGLNEKFESTKKEDKKVEKSDILKNSSKFGQNIVNIYDFLNLGREIYNITPSSQRLFVELSTWEVKQNKFSLCFDSYQNIFTISHSDRGDLVRADLNQNFDNAIFFSSTIYKLDLEFFENNLSKLKEEKLKRQKSQDFEL